MSTVIALRNISLQMGQSLLLQQINLDLAQGETGVIVGDTGSGKSTLIIETLYKAIAKRLHGARAHPGAYEKIEGLELIDKIVDIDQAFGRRQAHVERGDQTLTAGQHFDVVTLTQQRQRMFERMCLDIFEPS